MEVRIWHLLIPTGLYDSKLDSECTSSRGADALARMSVRLLSAGARRGDALLLSLSS